MHGVYDTVYAEDVAVNHVDEAVVDEQAVGLVGVLNDEFSVVHVGQRNLYAFGCRVLLGEIAYLVFAVVVAAVDNTVEDNDVSYGVAFVLVGECVPRCFGDESLSYERVEVLLDGVVRGGEDGVVPSCREELANVGLADVADHYFSEQTIVFAVLFVFAQITGDCLFLEDITSGCVDLFCAARHYQSDGCDNVKKVLSHIRY